MTTGRRAAGSSHSHSEAAMKAHSLRSMETARQSAASVRPRVDHPGTTSPATPVVRRLTPLELERLQGFPDGWTAGQVDSHRSKQLGNSVAVPVFEWVGRRLVAVDSALEAA